MRRAGPINGDPPALPASWVAAAMRSATLAAELMVEIETLTEAGRSRPPDTGEHGVLSTSDRVALVDRAERLYRQRRKRDAIFGASLFGEPAFDIMLDLYVGRVRGSAISISSCCIAAAVPATTALRWIVLLETRGLLVRSEDPFDGRRSLVSLSETGTDMMEQFLAEESYS